MSDNSSVKMSEKSVCDSSVTSDSSTAINLNDHFVRIYELARAKFKHCDISKLKTSSGNTQNCERYCISIIRDTLEELGYGYTEAGSQQPYDFRVKIEEAPDKTDTLLLEIKKTDSTCIYFNDTCPSSKAFYIVLFTGKEYKKKENILPCLFGINGSEFVEQDPWIVDYAAELNALKEKYRSMGDRMSVYPRPTYKAKIQFLFEKYYESAKLEIVENESKIEETPEKSTEKPEVFKIRRRKIKKIIVKTT